MSTRVANENDASRRLKSEFLVQFDGVTSNPNDLVIVIGKLYYCLFIFIWSFHSNSRHMCENLSLCTRMCALTASHAHVRTGARGAFSMQSG